MGLPMYKNGTRLVSVTPAAFCFTPVTSRAVMFGTGPVTHKSQISADSRVP